MPFQLEVFESALRQHGLSGGLKVLNNPVEHRYTGLYRLHHGNLVNVELHDKLGEIKPEFLIEVPLADSFCQFVLRDGLFRTSNTAEDHRLDGHKYQGQLLSYHGVPVVDNFGELYGTLCHFDALQRELSDNDFEVLRKAAKLIPGYLPKRA